MHGTVSTIVVQVLAGQIFEPAVTTAGDVVDGLAQRALGAVIGLAILFIAAGLGRAAQQFLAKLLPRPYGPMLSRAVAVVIWGIGGVFGLARFGVTTEVTLPILFTVLLVMAVVLVLGAAFQTSVASTPTAAKRMVNHSAPDQPEESAAAGGRLSSG